MYLFWQTYVPERIAWQIGSLSLHWYGIILVLAILAAFFYVRPYFIQRSVLGRAQVDDLFFYVIISGLIGARLGHVLFFNLPYYLSQPADIIKIWQGGLSIQGALFFSALTLWWWVRKNKVSLLLILDHLVPAVALGQAIGRWGNYFNQELYGRATDGWWGIYISADNRLPAWMDRELFHPAFFYESLLNFFLFLALRFLLKKDRQPTGLITLVYFAAYALIRFFLEWIRIDPTPLLFGLRLPQLISIVVLIATVLIAYRYRRHLFFRPR